jgi:hypothetical protein
LSSPQSILCLSPPLCSGGFVGSRYHCHYCILWIRHILGHGDRDDLSQVSRAHCGSTYSSPFTHVHPCRQNFWTSRCKPVEDVGSYVHLQRRSRPVLRELSRQASHCMRTSGL